jgi:hypothetical protein
LKLLLFLFICPDIWFRYDPRLPVSAAPAQHYIPGAVPVAREGAALHHANPYVAPVHQAYLAASNPYYAAPGGAVAPGSFLSQPQK